MRENENLRRLGRVIHVTQSKKILLKAERLPKIDERVIDGEGKAAGIVYDIFGPVSSPYVEVDPQTEELHRLKDRILYVIPSSRRKAKNKRGKVRR